MVGGFFEACALQWKALIGSALVTALLTLATGLDWLRIPTWFSLAVIAICWLPAPFMAWREERKTVLDLREKLAPRLEMRFLDNTENYFDLRNTPPTYRLFGVGIKNTGGTSVDDVEVKLKNIDPPVWSYGNLPLGSMHHEHGPLNPGAERFFDVVDQSAPGTVRIPHTVSGHPQGIP